VEVLSNRHNRKKEFTRTFFEDMGKNVEGAAKKALLVGGKIVTDEAKMLCPTDVDGEHSAAPGALQESVTFVQNRAGTRVKITAPAKNPKTGVPYGQFVEFWPGRKHPFLYPAMDARRDEVRGLVIKAVREAVQESVK